MIRSMTGFGDAHAHLDGAHYAVEVRSLNNKFLKVQVRVPEELQGLEAELETAVASRLVRGSIIVTVRFGDESAAAAAEINTNALQRYVDQMRQVPAIERGEIKLDLGSLINLPGVLISDTGEKRLQQARQALLGLITEACDKVIAMRAREGQKLHSELRKHGDRIAEHLAVVNDRVPAVAEEYQRRLRQRMEALLAESGGQLREEDVIREVAIFAERSDIAEEVSRLEGHLEQYAEIIDAADGEPAGRTLGFLSQEMLREANTISAKSLDVEIARRIVEIKSAIDRIKEQSQNVE
jgi:uncharacterized protein (TIGR00255 family)